MSETRRGLLKTLLEVVRASSEPKDLDDLDEARLAPRFVPPPPPEPLRSSGPQRLPLRPPGALEDGAFEAACTRCQACVSACPEQTLAPDTEGYPQAEVLRSACALCPSTPCIAACPSGALRPLAITAIRMGTAVLRPRLCLNADFLARAEEDEEPCFRCIDWCPVPEALAFRREAPLPEVNPEACVGCGLCVSGCPAYPVALTVVRVARVLSPT